MASSSDDESPNVMRVGAADRSAAANVAPSATAALPAVEVSLDSDSVVSV